MLNIFIQSPNYPYNPNISFFHFSLFTFDITTSALLSKRITAYFKNKFQHFQKYFFKAAFIKPIQTGPICSVDTNYIGKLSHIANKKFIFVCYSKVCIIALYKKHRNCIIRYTYTVEANCIKRSV